MAGQARTDHSYRLGWFYGFQLLVCTTADGVITGWALGEGSARDQRLADDFLRARHHQTPGAEPVGARVLFGRHGFEGARYRWLALLPVGVQVLV